MIGREVFGYRVEELIGKGSFASVYKVKKENESGTYVRALKHIVIPEKTQYLKIWNAMGKDTEKTEQYFENVFQETMQEIQLMHAFTENGVRNIVPCYENDVIRHENPKRYEIFLLMEYLTPLSVYISQNELVLNDVFELGIQILDALEICHENGVMHRDIKEENIFRNEKGVYKLGDFGVAKMLHGEESASSVKGTADYMAPEILQNKKGYNESVDLYSLGMVLYRIMNHMRSPFFPSYPETFDSEDEKEAQKRRLQGETVPLPDAADPAFGKVLRKALAPESERFARAEDFRRELLKVIKATSEEKKNSSVMAIRNGNAIQKKQSLSRKKSKIWKRIVILSIVCLLLGGAAQLYGQRHVWIQKCNRWEQATIFPFDCISTDMTEKDMQRYFGKRFSKGTDQQYYLEMEGNAVSGYVNIKFGKNQWDSISYSFLTQEENWKQICQNFYQTSDKEITEWPCQIRKDNVQVVMDYDPKAGKASLFIRRLS